MAETDSYYSCSSNTQELFRVSVPLLTEQPPQHGRVRRQNGKVGEDAEDPPFFGVPVAAGSSDPKRETISADPQTEKQPPQHGRVRLQAMPAEQV